MLAVFSELASDTAGSLGKRAPLRVKVPALFVPGPPVQVVHLHCVTRFN